MAYAERQFWLDTLIPGGEITHRQNFDRAAEQTGRNPEVFYQLPEVDNESLYLLHYFYEARSHQPLNYQEIQAWTVLTGRKLEYFEVRTLMLLEKLLQKVQLESNGDGKK